MENTSKPNSIKKRDVAYYRQRQKNRVFTELVKFFAEEAERRQITKKDLATALARDPAQITRWLSAPSNFELDTLSDILLALGAEMDHRIVRFDDRPKPNYAHPDARQSAQSNVNGPPQTTTNANVQSIPVMGSGIDAKANTSVVALVHQQ
jgi:hypothetical protein